MVANKKISARVIATSVIRSAHRGESHGGAYIIDLEKETYKQVIDWDTDKIDWEGRGGERGLRGIAFHDNKIYFAASDEIYVFDQDFHLIDCFKNKYLKNCHEINICNDKLCISSTGYDSIIEFDLNNNTFTQGYCIRDIKLRGFLNTRYGRTWRRIRRVLGIKQKIQPEFTIFDPNKENGPEQSDTIHINNVFCEGGNLFFSASMYEYLFTLTEEKITPYAQIPYGTHNPIIYRSGVLLNNTYAKPKQVSFLDKKGRVINSFLVPHYNEKELTHNNLPKDHAVQAFARGLCLLNEDMFIAGSSPATISVYQFSDTKPVKTINITKEIRNAIHGLEIWPY